MRTPVTIILAATATAGSLLAQDHEEQAAPFNALRWKGNDSAQAEVRLQKDWYEWTAINDVAVSDLVAFCKERWPNKWRKRVGEDLVEALFLMNHPVGTEVNLRLIDPSTGEEITRKRVPMTQANRAAVLAYNRGAREVPKSMKGPSIGGLAPELECKDLTGKTVSLQSFRGKTVLVDFWATWCKPCLAEIPYLKKAHDTWSSRGLVILGVSVDDANAENKVRKLVQERKLPWTVLHDNQTGNAKASAVWGVSQIPQCFLIDSEGRIRAIGLRGNQIERAISQLIQTGKIEAEALPASGAKNRLDDFAQLSPFTAARANGEDYEVRLDETWYRLISIEGISQRRIREYCEKNYADKAEKRFAEDLVEVLSGLGVASKRKVDLVLEKLDTKKEVKLSNVPMTEENRRKVWSHRNADRSESSVSRNIKRTRRTHAASVPAKFAFLAKRREWTGWMDGAVLKRKQAEQDLNQLEWIIEPHLFLSRPPWSGLSIRV